MSARDAFADVGRAIRAGHLQLRRANLESFDRRVFDALIDVVFSYSRLEDTTTATQIARWVYDLSPELVAGWHRKKVQASLRRLHKAGVVDVDAETGRPMLNAENRIFVSLPAIETGPGSGVRYQDDDDRNGTRGEVPQEEKRDPTSRETGPDFDENGTHTGCHTEKVPEEVLSEESYCASREIEESLPNDSGGAPEVDAVEVAVAHFARVNARVDEYAVRNRVMRLLQLGMSHKAIVDQLPGTEWPSQLREPEHRIVPPTPRCDRCGSKGWLISDPDADDRRSRPCPDCNKASAA